MFCRETEAVTFKEKLHEAVGQMYQVICDHVHSGEIPIDQVETVPLKDYLDEGIMGHFARSPIAHRMLRKRLRATFLGDTTFDPDIWAEGPERAPLAHGEGLIEELKRQNAELERELLQMYRDMEKYNWRYA